MLNHFLHTHLDAVNENHIVCMIHIHTWAFTAHSYAGANASERARERANQSRQTRCGEKRQQLLCWMMTPLFAHCSGISFRSVLLACACIYLASTWVYVQIYIIYMIAVRVLLWLLPLLPLLSNAAAAAGRSLRPAFHFNDVSCCAQRAAKPFCVHNAATHGILFDSVRMVVVMVLLLLCSCFIFIKFSCVRMLPLALPLLLPLLLLLVPPHSCHFQGEMKIRAKFDSNVCVRCVSLSLPDRRIRPHIQTLTHET